MVARPGAPGDVDAAAARACAAAEAAFQAAFHAVAPGVPCAAIDAAARACFAEAGYDCVPTGAGLVYNLITPYDGRIAAGDLRAYNTRLLEEGMVLMLEPWAAVPGVGAPRRADMVRVTSSGATIVTEGVAPFLTPAAAAA